MDRDERDEMDRKNKTRPFDPVERATIDHLLEKTNTLERRLQGIEIDLQNEVDPVDRAEFERRLKVYEVNLEWISDRENILAHEIDKLIDKVEALDSEVRHLMAKDQAPMKAQPDSDGWIPWEGGECPVRPFAVVEYKTRHAGDADWTKERNTGNASWLRWRHAGWCGDIIAYRPVKQEPSDPSGWISWHGGECPPVPDEVLVDVLLRSGDTGTDVANHYSWHHIKRIDGTPGSADIIAYRPVKQEAEWPQVGDQYWYAMSSGTGEVAFGWWENFDIDRGRRDFLGIYPTREAAEEAAGKIKKVMDHWREGGTVDLLPDRYTALRQGIKL